MEIRNGIYSFDINKIRELNYGTVGNEHEKYCIKERREDRDLIFIRSGFDFIIFNSEPVDASKIILLVSDYLLIRKRNEGYSITGLNYKDKPKNSDHKLISFQTISWLIRASIIRYDEEYNTLIDYSLV